MNDYIAMDSVGLEFLEHHGILGQRWGVRRYQNPDGSLTAAGKIRYAKSKTAGVQKAIEKKIKQKQKEREKKRKAAEPTEEEKAEQARKEKEELKNYLRDHPKKLPKYAKQLTREDAKEIIDNIEFDRKLKDVSREERRRGMEQIKSISNNIKTMSDLMQNSRNLWNNSAYIYNMMVDNSYVNTSKKIPIIATPKEDKDDKK